MRTTLIITGTHCHSCEILIDDVAREQRGVSRCTVEHATGKTVIEHDGTFSLEAFAKELSSVGEYRVGSVVINNETSS